MTSKSRFWQVASQIATLDPNVTLKSLVADFT